MVDVVVLVLVLVLVTAADADAVDVACLVLESQRVAVCPARWNEMRIPWRQPYTQTHTHHTMRRLDDHTIVCA